MANTIDWGKATQNNTNGFGKYQNTINAGDIYAESWAGETVIIGTSAAFSYSKSSYHQGEADPTPTITGTTGGTFSGTSGIVFVDSGTNSGSSTGQVDLSASTIQANTITYTVSGVSANFSLAVTASPFLANTYSMDFDSASSQYVDAGLGLGDSLGTYTGDLTLSYWFNTDSLSANRGLFYIGSFSNAQGEFQVNIYANSMRFRVDSGTQTKLLDISSLSTGTWYHIAFVYKAGNISDSKVYLNGVEQSTTDTGTFPSSLSFSGLKTIIGGYYGTGNTFDGKLDEFAVWNTALSSDAVQEIYNATNNNSGKALDLSTDSGNYTNSSSLQYWNRLGD